MLKKIIIRNCCLLFTELAENVHFALPVVHSVRLTFLRLSCLSNNMAGDEDTEKVREFICHKCNLKVRYDYFGSKPPFAKSIR